MKYPINNYFKHYGGVILHKIYVFWYCLKFSTSLMWRSLIHDVSKFKRDESEGFLKVAHLLKKSTYGSPEYFALIEKIKPSIEKHYNRNSHHPEYWGQLGISGMGLLDVCEMFCDWQAAVKKHKNGNIFKSIEHNEKRFNMSRDLGNILFNSVPAKYFQKEMENKRK